MNFNSLEFLIFLPVVVLLYWLLPHKGRWILLLAASYLFYMSWNVWLVGLIFLTTLTAYIAGIGIDRTENKKAKKAWLVGTLIICLGALVFFKYINFILESVTGIVRLFHSEQDDIVLNVILPVGISFYTFQTLSYVIDVYRGDFKAERHFGYFALYVSYFPQLVAGPIERPQTLLPQLKERHHIEEEDLLSGAKWLLSGFFRKCVVADFCGIFVNKVYADLGNANGLAVFAASALFLIQIYNDFAGYSEIAMGSARLMGVRLTKNFDKPLTSTSYTEFFRRWHITLNQWFTQYVYIPLGGNRKGKARKILNTLIVFTLCGLWHGANWTFVLWGLVAGVAVSVETLLKKSPKTSLPPANAATCATHAASAKIADSMASIVPDSTSSAVAFTILANSVAPAATVPEAAADSVTTLPKTAVSSAKADENPTVRLLRQIAIFILFTFSCVLFRAQSLREVGIAFRQMFTAWDWSEGYFDSALSALGMNAIQILQLTVAIVTMSLLYRLTEERREPSLGLLCPVAYTEGKTNVGLFIYGIFAVVLFWLGLLSSGDVSGFEYFQF